MHQRDKQYIEIDNTKEIDIKKLMYNLIEYSDNYSKISGHLLEYWRNEPFLDDNGNIAIFPAKNKSVSFKFKQKNS